MLQIFNTIDSATSIYLGMETCTIGKQRFVIVVVPFYVVELNYDYMQLGMIMAC